ncbi:MAG: TIGR03620 family F420-dependent LLM class oxidoreductase, partial [Deltaproteobacteria bacterium]|nr:TIGR03620 family F420-dependent LLM class oxidoreductase [Deltaproteobacteria bacterium]
ALTAAQAAEAAQRIESLGYGAFWIPEAIGRHPFAHAAWLLAKTERLVVATGIANIYARDAAATAAAQKTLAEQSGGRFLLGLGVSHRPMVEGVRGHVYASPVATMRAYLERMEKAPYAAFPPAEAPPTVLAALGPKMLQLAATKTKGAHPYFTTPEHTAMARKTMGPDAWLCVEQKVLLETDPAKARNLARLTAAIYLGLENYRNNWKRLGFADSDFANGGSDRFIDATVAWGDVSVLQKRVRAHLDAGASHVCIQPINPSGQPVPDWKVLEALAPGRAG